MGAWHRFQVLHEGPAKFGTTRLTLGSLSTCWQISVFPNREIGFFPDKNVRLTILGSQLGANLRRQIPLILLEVVRTYAHTSYA